MPQGILSKRANDVLNRAAAIKSEIDFCGEEGGLASEMYHFAEWLGDHLRAELQREAWQEPELFIGEDGVFLYLYSGKWRVPDEDYDDDYVAFCFWWPNLFEESPSVQLYLPAEEKFEQRNVLLNRLRPKLKRSGFTDYYEDGDPDPSSPLWKNIRLEEFHGESGFELDSFVSAIADGFRQLIEVEPLIDEAFQARGPEKPPPPPSERQLKTIAFLDTECQGSGSARKMTELGIVNVAYDAEADEVVGILEEYCMDFGETLDEPKSRGVLERADFIVAHNAFVADRPLLASHLPGTENMEWLCSFQGIEWKQLLGVQSESLETLAGKAGLQYEQEHHACADARVLKRLLAYKHKGRTFLGRLLGSNPNPGGLADKT
jgi:hypothetical protein